MSSNFKKETTKKDTNYTGETIGDTDDDVVTLPPDAEDVILVTKCANTSGSVKATLEHSPTGKSADFASNYRGSYNWCLYHWMGKC